MMRSPTWTAVAAGVSLLTSAAALGASTVRESTLPNGAPLLAALDAAAPRQSVSVIFETGCRLLPKGQGGVVNVFEPLLQEGPLDQSAAEFRRELFLLNAAISTTSDGRRFQLTVSAPPGTLEAALQKAGTLLRRPKLTDGDVSRALQTALALRRAEQQSLRFMVRLAALRHLYRDHPDAAPCTSSIADLEKVQLASVRGAWQALTQPDRRMFGTLGPMPAEQVAALLRKTLLKGSKIRYKPAAKVAPAEFPQAESSKTQLSGTEVVLLEQPGGQDNQVWFVWPHALQIDSPGYAVGEVAMTLLGNASTGRLSQELREQRGLTYDARAYFASNLPHYAATTFAGAEQIAQLLRELPRVYQAFVEETPLEQQFEVAKRTLVTAFRGATELPADGFRLALEARLFGRDPNAWQGRAERWDAVSFDSLQRFIRTRMSNEPACLVLAGDRGVLLKALEQAGYATASIRTLRVEEL
jgi:zinc protease